MALNKDSLKNSIQTLLSDMRTREDVSDSEFATRLADAIDAFVRTGEVGAGIPVSTTGSATAQTGQTTASKNIT